MRHGHKIRFLHIPKSAGTSFSNCLRRIYKANRFKKNVFVFLGDLAEDSARYTNLSQAERDKLALVSGHAPLLTGIPEVDGLPTITFLRDPVARVKSLCQHISEGKVRNITPSQNIDTFLADPCNFWIENLQTRTLLGERGYGLPDIGEEAIIAQAMDVLENRLACFGITEYFDDSLLLFKHILGWNAYPVYTRLNQKSRVKQLQFTEAQIQLIRERNAIDLKVYTAALALFKSRLATHEGEITALRRGFAIRQKLFHPILGIYRLYHRLQLARSGWGQTMDAS